VVWRTTSSTATIIIITIINKQVFIADPVILFVPVAADTLGTTNKDVMNFLSDRGRRIMRSTDDH